MATAAAKLIEQIEAHEPKGRRERLLELIDELEAEGFDNDRLWFIANDLRAEALRLPEGL